MTTAHDTPAAAMPPVTLSWIATELVAAGWGCRFETRPNGAVALTTARGELDGPGAATLLLYAGSPVRSADEAGAVLVLASTWDWRSPATPAAATDGEGVCQAVNSWNTTEIFGCASALPDGTILLRHAAGFTAADSTMLLATAELWAHLAVGFEAAGFSPRPPSGGELDAEGARVAPAQEGSQEQRGATTAFATSADAATPSPSHLRPAKLGRPRWAERTRHFAAGLLRRLRQGRRHD